MSNKLTRMASEILLIEDDLIYRIDLLMQPYPTLDDFDLYTFEQTWGSTALGFGGIGGQALTTARTYVFVPNAIDHKCLVYFAGRFAYAADYCDEFMKDVQNGNMASVARSGKYKKAKGMK